MSKEWEPKERKSFPFELDEKDGVDVEERRIKGYFAVCGNFDGQDVIEYGAFKKTLKEQGNRIKSFWIHEFNEPIGKPVEIKEVPRGKLPQKLLDRVPDATGGLYADIKISHTRRGDEALVLARDGVFDEGSIGFDTVKVSWEEGEDGSQIRHIKELKLYDVSPVPLAMNVGAIITDVKSAWEEKVEESEDFIHVPAPGQEGKHEGHRIRYIDIDADKGIRAKYCGECKVIISYVFAKENGWTVPKAVAWVKEHAKEKSEEIEARETVAMAAIRQAEIAAHIQRAQIQKQEIEAL